MPKLIIVRGLPGSGKSTKAKSFGIFHVEADMYFMKNGEYKWYRTGLNHKWCQNMVEQAMQREIDVVVSNTFTTLKEMKPYLDMAVEFGYCVDVIRCVGNFKNTHDVPEDTLEAMKHRFEYYKGHMEEEFYDPTA